MKHISKDASARLTELNRLTRGTSLLSGGRRVLTLASALLLPVAVLAQAGGGGGGATGGAAAGSAGASGAAGSSAAGGTASGAVVTPPPATPAQPPAPQATPPAAAEEGPTGMPEGWWENWSDFKKNVRDDIGLEFNIYGEAVWRNALAGFDTDAERGIARYDVVTREHFSDDSLLSMQVRGGWGDGLDPLLGFFSNTDQYAQTPEQIFILHLYYQQELFNDQLTLRIGKFDIGDWLDTNRYGYYNFLAYVMAHNTTIPLTGNTLGAMATWEPKDAGWYISGGGSNAAQTATEAGFNTLFDGQADWLAMAEVGFKPKFGDREGVYRFTGWHSSHDFVNTVGESNDNSWGGAVSFDQDITEQLGVFARYGVTDGNPFEPKSYYGAGIHIKEPIPGRTKDTLALGFALNEFSDNRNDTVANSSDNETYIELYYNLQLFPWMQIQPVLQYVDNPGGLDQEYSFIGGVHLHLAF